MDRSGGHATSCASFLRRRETKKTYAIGIEDFGKRAGHLVSSKLFLKGKGENIGRCVACFGQERRTYEDCQLLLKEEKKRGEL